MANIKFSRKLFEKEIGNLDEKMKSRIAMFGTPLEAFNENEIELEIFPNRPDLLSYQGFKRSFLAFLGKKTCLPNYKMNKPEKNYEVIIDKSVESIRPFTACAIVKKLKFNDDKIKEIIDIQEKLHFTLGRKRKKIAIGIYPLEKIKLPIIFKALEPEKIRFHPLESEKEMSGLEILQRHPVGKEYAHLLAGKEKFPIFVDSNDSVLSMPPIINSHSTGKITNETSEIFIECSGFDFEILKKCLNILTACLADMGGEIYQMDIKYKSKVVTPDFEPERMKISLENVNKLLGINLNEKQIKNYLERMGYNFNPSNMEVLIPSWRADILHEVDLIEDIAIAYGYENFIPEIPSISTIGQENTQEIIKQKLGRVLTGVGFIEVSNYHLTSKNEQFVKMDELEKNFSRSVEVENSKTEFNTLRKDLSHYLLKVLSENVDVEYPQLIFETGKVFYDIQEKDSLAFAITPGNFTQAKQILEYLERMIDIKITITNPDFRNTPPFFIDGRVGEVAIEGKKSGFIGEVHPKILKNWHLKMPVAIAEISLDEIYKKLAI